MEQVTEEEVCERFASIAPEHALTLMQLAERRERAAAEREFPDEVRCNNLHNLIVGTSRYTTFHFITYMLQPVWLRRTQRN
jgi:hypothetical protein